MPKKLAVIIAVSLFGTLVLAFPRVALSQGSGSTRVPNSGTQPYRPPAAQPQAARTATPEEFYQSFWKHIVRQQDPYTKWAKLREADRPEAKDAHGVFVRIYANKPAAENPKEMPLGAILVMQNYDTDQKTLRNISVMYRVKGSDPKHSDWYWLEYLPNGSIAKTPAKEGNKAIAGKVKSCIECHQKAEGNDLVFSNEPAKSQEPSERKRADEKTEKK